MLIKGNILIKVLLKQKLQKERKGGLLGTLFGTFGAYLLGNCYQVHKHLSVIKL